MITRLAPHNASERRGEKDVMESRSASEAAFTHPE